jgi:hypothetical protein
MIKDQEIL